MIVSCNFPSFLLRYCFDLVENSCLQPKSYLKNPITFRVFLLYDQIIFTGMSTTKIILDKETHQKLAIFKYTHRCSTLNDAVARLLDADHG